MDLTHFNHFMRLVSLKYLISAIFTEIFRVIHPVEFPRRFFEENWRFSCFEPNIGILDKIWGFHRIPVEISDF